jgi:hypothetical protein
MLRSLLLLFALSAINLYGQTSNKIIEEKSIVINREVDSLSVLLESTIKERELQSQSLKVQIESIKQKVHYKSLVQQKGTLDSLIENRNVLMRELEKIALRDNILDSLLIRHKLSLSPNWESYPKISFNISSFDKDFNLERLNKNGLAINSKDVENIKEKSKELVYTAYKDYFERISPYYFEHSSILKEELLFNLQDGKFDDSKSEEKFRKLLGEFDCTWPTSYYFIVKASSYNNLTLKYILSKCYSKKLDLDDIKNDEYIILNINKGYDSKTYNSHNNTPLGWVFDIKFNDYELDHLTQSQPIGVKKLEKIKEMMSQYNIEFKQGTAVDAFWKDYGDEILLFKSHLTAKQDLPLIKNEADSIFRIRKKVIDDINKTDSEVSKLEKESSTLFSNLNYKIDDLKRRIAQKEERLNKVVVDEKYRVELISEADNLIKLKAYDQAISKLTKAQQIYQHKDVQSNLDNANKLYAPILAKKQEEETKRNTEIEGNRLKENEDWHSEDLLKKWLLTAPFYNYEKTVKVEFREEYVEDYNIGWMIWVYVNGNKEGELIEYKLRGSPHNTFIGIKWIRTGKIETVINVVSSSEKVMKSKRGVMTGIGAIKNGSNLRREGCSFE